MINDFIIKIIMVFDNLYNNFGVSSLLEDLLEKVSTFEDYLSDFEYYLGGVYFVLGKPLVIFMVSVFGIIFTIRLVMAIVNIVGQFIP